MKTILVLVIMMFASTVFAESIKDVLDKSEKIQKPVVIVFSAEWCGPCKTLKADVVQGNLKEALSEYDIYFVDIDKSPELAKKYGVTSVPDSRIFHGNKPKASFSGYNRAAYKAWLTKNK